MVLNRNNDHKRFFWRLVEIHLAGQIFDILAQLVKNEAFFCFKIRRTRKAPHLRRWANNAQSLALNYCKRQLDSIVVKSYTSSFNFLFK